MKKYFCDICKEETDRLYECVVPVKERKEAKHSSGAVMATFWGIGTSNIDICWSCANKYVALHSALSNYPHDNVEVYVDLQVDLSEDVE